MTNDRKRWLYSKTEKERIFEVGEEISGEWYDSPAFSDTKTVMVSNQRATPLEPVVDRVEIKKYPSQMSKPELVEHGKIFGLSFDESMSKNEMRRMINQALKGEADEKQE